MTKRIALFFLTVVAFPSCQAIFLYSMGARGHAVPLRQISSLYYKTSPDLKKAYVFYAIPGQIATGESVSYGPGNGFDESITIEFGAVRANSKNEKEYGKGIYSHQVIGEEWMQEVDLGDGLDAKRPHDQQVKIFYGIERRDKGESIPYRGVWLPNRKARNHNLPTS